ncbi:putative photosystem II [Helianthus annuus]|nr:putative photosystem II [Helianthus annuus]
MTAILDRRESESLWGRFCNWITSTENRLYIGWTLSNLRTPHLTLVKVSLIPN